jgi:beta-carotene 3-hydroxylase
VTGVALAVAALIVMEPLTTLAHRVVFHGFAMGWHRSHHLPPRAALEANVLFPAVFALLTIGVLSIGVWVGAGSVLVPIGIGVTAYGAAYLVVHDLVIHRRVRLLHVADRVGHRLRAAHNVHHLFGQAPYGFLAPIVPRTLRDRADARGVDDTARDVTRRRPA